MRRLLQASVGVALLAASAAAPTSAWAATSQTTQTLSFTASGVLSVGVANLTFPATVAPGQDVTNQPVGAISVTDNLNDGVPWTLQVTATDVAATALNYVPASDITFSPGTVTAGNAAGTTVGPSANFTEPTVDLQPGTTQSPGLTIFSGQSTAQGSWTLGGSTLAVALPTSITTGSTYRGTLTYTLSG